MYISYSSTPILRVYSDFQYMNEKFNLENKRLHRTSFSDMRRKPTSPMFSVEIPPVQFCEKAKDAYEVFKSHRGTCDRAIDRENGDRMDRRSHRRICHESICP